MSNPYDIVRQFEQTVAEFAGAPHAVAVDSCTAALFLSCRYMGVREVTIPARTFFSVPCSIIHAGGSVGFLNTDWQGAYRLHPYPIIDAACRFRRGMYCAGSFWCASFDARKHLPIGRGGMILTDDADAANWFRLARFHGRDEAPRMESVPRMIGWKMHMHPEDALRGLSLLNDLPGDLPDIELEYPDLSQFGLYEEAGRADSV